jgi:hypothetical protein
VAILNPDSTLHDRIAFCWESANAIDSFADMCQFNDNDDIQRVGAILHHQITPLLQLLSFLGASTSQNRIGDAS